MNERLPTPDKIKEEKERIKEEVQAFKERTEGLNPEMFGVPGEGMEEKSEIPEELIEAHKLEEKQRQWYKKLEKPQIKEKYLNRLEYYLKNSKRSKWKAEDAFIEFGTFYQSPLWHKLAEGEQNEILLDVSLLENSWLEQVKSRIEEGKNDQMSAAVAVQEFFYLYHSPLWHQLTKVEQEELIRGIESLKNTYLKKVKLKINESKTDPMSTWESLAAFYYLYYSPLWPQLTDVEREELIQGIISIKDSWLAELAEVETFKYDINNHPSRHILEIIPFLTPIIAILKNLANRKLKEQERQKALYPEKDIPPRPETKAF